MHIALEYDYLFLDSNLDSFLAPNEFTSIPFPVKALKLILHDIKSDGEAASMGAPAGLFDADPDDDVIPFFYFWSLSLELIVLFQDTEWVDEGGQAPPKNEFAYLSDLIGPKGMAFDNDEVLDSNDDEDLQNDPVSQMDMQVSE